MVKTKVHFKKFLASVVMAMALVANFAPTIVEAAPVSQNLMTVTNQSYTDKPNLVKTSGDYLQATTIYEVNGNAVLTVDIFYRLQKDGTYKAVYYNCVNADGSISFSERDIADTDNVIYVDDNDLGLEKGQIVWAEIRALLDEVGYY